MFIQPATSSTQLETDNEPLKIPDTKSKRDMFKEVNKVTTYKSQKRGNPKPMPEYDTTCRSDTSEQRARGFLHACVRLSADGSQTDASEQRIGAFSGFQASFEDPMDKNEAYYFKTLPQPPSKSVVHEVMCQCAEACEYKTMPFIQLVGDQPVYALILEVKNENPEKFKKVLPVMGGFHIQTAFFSTIYKRFSGCGLEEWVVSAGIIASGSVEQALRGKHYKRALRIHKLVYECLLRLLIAERPDVPPSLQSVFEKIRNESDPEERQLLVEDALTNPELKDFIHATFDEISAAGSDMARLWMSYLEMVEILLMNYHALRTQDWESYLHSLRLMQPWMAVYDNLHYSRYMTVFWASMNNLKEEWATYMRSGLFSASLTGNPYSAIPLDQWIEVTMNKGSKMKGGWIGITKNETRVNINTRTVNKINNVRQTLHDAADDSKRKRGHSENTRSRITQDEQCVQDLESCITEWESNPWDLSNPILRTLESGRLAPPKLIDDFNTAKERGEELVNTFYTERVLSDEKLLIDRISLNKRCSFNKPPKDSLKESSVNKTDAMESKAMKDLVVVAQQKALNMKEVMTHRLTDVPLSLFNVDKGMRKNVKSKLFTCFNTDQQLHESDDNVRRVAIVDMGFIWRYCTPTKEDRESNFTWGDYAKKIYNTIHTRHPDTSEFHLINDRYDVNDIKDSEHQRRVGSSFIKGSANVFPKRDNQVPSAMELNHFFKNSANKERLQRFLLTEFRDMTSLADELIYYTLREECVDLQTGRQEPRFTCHQHEADTRIFFHLSIIDRPDTLIYIDAEDTDVAVIAAYMSHHIQGELRMLRRRQVYDCKQFCSPDMASVIIPLHAFTGADAISGFYGHGKSRIFASVTKSEEARECLRELGKDIEVSTQLRADMTIFTIRAVYNDARSKTLPEARERKWDQMKNKRTAMLPPDPESFDYHLRRANYQANLWYDYDNPNPPVSPVGHGWQVEGGAVLPILSMSSPIPSNLSDLLTSVTSEDESSEFSECSDSSDTDIDDNY